MELMLSTISFCTPRRTPQSVCVPLCPCVLLTLNSNMIPHGPEASLPQTSCVKNQKEGYWLWKATAMSFYTGLVLEHLLRCESRSSRKGNFCPLPGLFLSTDLSKESVRNTRTDRTFFFPPITPCLNGYSELPLGLPCNGLTTRPGCVLASYASCTVSPGQTLEGLEIFPVPNNQKPICQYIMGFHEYNGDFSLRNKMAKGSVSDMCVCCFRIKRIH